MRHERKNVNNGKQVVLKFTLAKGDPTLDDDVIKETMAKEKLRAVTKAEFEDYCRKVLGENKPATPLAMFGNCGRGPFESGGFVGIMYLDVDGEVKISENWTRGNSGKEWGGDWEFLLAPAGA